MTDPELGVRIPARPLPTALRGSKADLVARSGRPDRLAQVGWSLLADPLPVPLAAPGDPARPPVDDALHETFVVDGPVPFGSAAAGRAEAVAMGADLELARWWQPTVEELIDRVARAVEVWGVVLEPPVYVSVSTTPIDRVVDQPHFDDDRFDPDDGVGLAAIVASHLGPRVAMGELPCAPPVAGLPIALADGAVPDPDDSTSWWQGPADRVVLITRFGQLHRGPRPANLVGLADGPGTDSRSLLVLRAGTVPA